MGLTHVDLAIANPAKPEHEVSLQLLVDSGAAYSVVPSAILDGLGIAPTGQRRFVLADGTEIVRRTGVALFRFRGEEGGSTASSARKATRRCSASSPSRSSG